MSLQCDQVEKILIFDLLKILGELREFLEVLVQVQQQQLLLDLFQLHFELTQVEA
jgi:hypothetical protein